MNAAFLAERKEGTYEPSLYTEQYCINELSRAMEEKNDPALLGQRSAEGDPRNFRKVLPSALLFPDGKAFFDEKRSQWANVAPAVIHNNWIMGAGGKWGRMVDWGMVSIADQGEARAAEVAKKILRERRAPRAEDGEGVCAPVPVVPREPVPLRAVSTSPSSSSSSSSNTPNTQNQAQEHVHPFHMHVRLFLSPEASDGREHPQGPEAEFANLRRAVHALIDADYTSATVLSSAAANPAGTNAAAILKPSVHVEIMLDLFAHPVPSSSSSASLSAEAKAEQAEWERLKAELKKLKAAWVAKFGEPASNGYTFVLEIKRPRASAAANGRPSSRVGPLGLCSMPWPKVAGSSEDTEARTTESESPSQQGSGGSVVNPRHHDASLFLHDSVTLSPQWFTFTHALLQAYHAGVVPGGEHSLDDSFVDPRVYGISLLDAHQLQGETVHRRLNASQEGQADRTAFAESALAATGIFNSTSATWRRVRHLAAHRARVAMATAAGKSSSSSLALQHQQQSQQPSEVALRAQLPNAFVSTRVFGFQQLSEFGALVWLPGHFDNWVAWLQEQHIPDTLNSTATLPSMDDASAPPGRLMAATKCVPGLASNALVQSLPPEQTWAQWINRWAYERGFYPLHARATEVQVSGASAEDIKKLQEALDKNNKDKGKDKDTKDKSMDLNKIVPLKAKDQKQRLAVALTAEQAAAAAAADKKDSGAVSSVSLLSRPLGLFDLLLPPASTVPVFDFTLHVVRAPVTLAYRSLLAPAERVDQCYSLAQYEQRMDDIAANEARIKAEEAARKAAIKAVKDAEKKKKADAEKAAKAAAKAKLDAEKAKKAKAEADTAAAAAKKKKAAADKAAADKKKKSTTDAAAAAAAKKKKAEQDKAKKASAAATPAKKKKKATTPAPAAAAEDVADTDTPAAAAPAAVVDEGDGSAPVTEEALPAAAAEE
jgi:hypothetical protein